MWLAQVICRLVYSVYQDNGGNYYNNGSSTTTAAAAVAAETVMTTTTNVNRLLLTEARVDQLDCGGPWTLDCRRPDGRPDGALACTDALRQSADAVVRLYLPAELSAHFDGQPAVSVGLPETARQYAVTVVRCDGGGDGGGGGVGGDGNQVTCSVHGDRKPPEPVREDEGLWRRYNWKYLFVIVFIASGGVGNILVCLAICLDRQLQNVTNYFLLSLAIADLLVCLFVMPLGALPGFYGEYPPPSSGVSLFVPMCAALGFFLFSAFQTLLRAGRIFKTKEYVVSVFYYRRYARQSALLAVCVRGSTHRVNGFSVTSVVIELYRVRLNKRTFFQNNTSPKVISVK